MMDSAVRDELEVLKQSIRDLADNQNSQVSRNEFESFKSSMRSVADNLTDRVEIIIEEVKKLNCSNHASQRSGTLSSSSAEIGLDGPALGEDIIEMEEIQQGNAGTQGIY